MDLTATFMTVLMVNVYILILMSCRFWRKWGIFILGILFFLALKTKETAFVASITLMLGILYEILSNKERSGSRWLRTLVLGFLAGVGLFVVLNTLVLGDPFFGFRMSDIKIFINSYVSGAVVTPKVADGQNWFSGFWFRYLYVPYLLYLVGGVKYRNSMPFPLRIIWVTPLLVTLFVVFSVNNAWGYDFRFVLPSLPIVAMLAGVFVVGIRGDHRTTGDQPGTFWISMIATALILGLKWFALLNQWDWYYFVYGILHPVLLSAIMLTIFLVRSEKISSRLILIVVIMAIVPGLITNIKQMFIVRSNFHIFENTVYPLRAFSSKLSAVSSENRICIDGEVFKQPGTAAIVKDVNEFTSLFVFLLDARSLSPENVKFFNTTEDLYGVGWAYKCAFILTVNSPLLSNPGFADLGWMRNYSILIEPKGIFAFLEAQ